jgi:RNA polymerase sigma factor (TIGR02999 family)
MKFFLTGMVSSAVVHILLKATAITDVTRILTQIEAGDPTAAAQLLPLVYDELRKLAAAKMAAERPEHTLEATALVHEAYVRLLEPDGERHWNDRRHFFVVAAEAMRQILIEDARQKKAWKRGGQHRRMQLDPNEVAATIPAPQLLALNDALEEFSERDPIKSELVKLRYFSGLTMAEAADLLEISHATAERYWAYSRAWLQCRLSE